MTGCLTFPLRMLATLLLVAGLAAGWFFRDEVTRFGRRQLRLPDPPSAIGRPDPASLASGTARLDSLVGGQADSVLVTPAEMASLAARTLGSEAGGTVDSLAVELDDRELALRARVATAPLPASIRDLMGGALAERETVEVTGALALRRAGVGELEVRRVRVRGFPVPRDLVGRVLGRYHPRTEGRMVLFDVPPAVTGIRVTPRGVILYGSGTR